MTSRAVYKSTFYIISEIAHLDFYSLFLYSVYKGSLVIKEMSFTGPLQMHVGYFVVRTSCAAVFV